MPYPSFVMSAQVLDNKRLGKQRVEAFQILKAITGQSTGWINHPATQMWVGYENALKLYINYCIREWTKRGFKNTMDTYLITSFEMETIDYPTWFGEVDFHRSHQLMLLKKDNIHYSKYFDATDFEINNASYIWPKRSN